MKLPKWTLELKWQFLALMGLGGLAFFVALWVYPAICSSSQQIEGDKDTKAHATKNEYTPSHVQNEIISSRIPEKNTKTDHEEQESAETYSNGSTESLFCGIKITDLFLALFTYCLVIVGWFQIRSSEKTVRELERAFVFTNARVLPREKDKKPMLKILACNFGRTPGMLKECYYIVSDHAPEGDKPVYVGGKSIPMDNGINPTTTTTEQSLFDEIDPPKIYIENGNCFVYGFTIYEDIFHISHTNRFSVNVVGGGYNKVAGHHAWNKDD